MGGLPKRQASSDSESESGDDFDEEISQEREAKAGESIALAEPSKPVRKKPAGLFDDSDEEDSEDDIFAPVKKQASVVEKEVAGESPDTKVDITEAESSTASSSQKRPVGGVSLFGDFDPSKVQKAESHEDVNSTEGNSVEPALPPPHKQATKGLFADDSDEEDDFFAIKKPKGKDTSAPSSNISLTPSTGVSNGKAKKGLFNFDDSDSEDDSSGFLSSKKEAPANSTPPQPKETLAIDNKNTTDASADITEVSSKAGTVSNKVESASTKNEAIAPLETVTKSRPRAKSGRRLPSRRGRGKSAPKATASANVEKAEIKPKVERRENQDNTNVPQNAKPSGERRKKTSTSAATDVLFGDVEDEVLGAAVASTRKKKEKKARRKNRGKSAGLFDDDEDDLPF